MILPYVEIDPDVDGVEFDRPITVKTELHRVDLAKIPNHVTLLRTGFGAPFSLLPDRIISLLLTTEAELLSRSNVTSGGLWVDEWWDPRLIEICEALQIPSIVSPRITTSGTLRRFHSTRTGFVCKKVGISDFQQVEEISPMGPAAITPPDDNERLDTDLVLLRRTFHRAMARISDRPGVATLQALPAAVAGAAYSASSTADERLRTRRSLLALRTAMDRDRKRSGSWGRLRRTDWDGDGREEIELETASVLIMCDPETASLPTVADKVGLWPVSSIGGDPGWLIARHVKDLEQEMPTPIALTVEGLEESKDRLVLTLESDDLSARLTVKDRSIAISMDAHGIAPGLIGPEITLQLAAARIRADGSEWSELSEPVARLGHKFRISDGVHDVLLVSPTPSTLFIRPTADGAIIWAHWNTDGNSHHEATISFDN